VPLPELSVGTAIIFVDVCPHAISELWLEPLPSILLARDVLPVLAAVGQVETPQIAYALRRRRIELVKDLVRYCAGVTKVSRPSRDATASGSLPDRESVFSAIFDELIFTVSCEHAASNLSTSLAGILISLPRRKPASAPWWNI
jgi:hypothetical protein